MTVSFKQFSTFLSASEGIASPEKLDEIFGKIFGKPEDKEAKLDKLNTAKDALELKKQKDAERKKELERKRNEAWLNAKERADRKVEPTGHGSHRDDYAQHRATMGSSTRLGDSRLREGKQSYSEHGYWSDDAKAAGYKIKKLSGNLEDGDQTWGAFDDDKKVGEFTEKEEGRGGWLL